MSSVGGGDVRALTWAYLGAEGLLELLTKWARRFTNSTKKAGSDRKSKAFLAGRFPVRGNIHRSGSACKHFLR
jgi:hypothetical protein